MTPSRNPATRAAFLASMVLTILGQTGCATSFKEHHFFQSVDAKGRPTNYYRLTVSGYGAMSSTRYVSGYYDERAVDLFFNEVKVGQTPENATGVQTLFVDKQMSPGTDQTIKPLDPTKQHGAFVMILSTNASSVARTIGQFAENQLVADAITNLANRDAILRDTQSARTKVARANTTSDELEKLFELLPEDAAPSKEESERSTLRILNAIGTGLSGTPTRFESLDQADAWFSRATVSGGTP